jgi:3,4-dihydroxy 2-butanone 4-phosphate synthase/GTP cyclohydrolase II
MVNHNGAQFSTNFTLSIEAAKGVTTGISASDRATTIAAAVNQQAVPSDLVQPGHIFPIMAQPGGVLMRAGHTEAGCDLARLAGHTAASVIVEILNDDGTMARRPQLEKFAKKHDLKIGTIADLIEYRSNNEKTVEKISECLWPTEFGEFKLNCFKDSIDGELHFALTMGEIIPEHPSLVRVHRINTFTDLLQGQRSASRSWTLSEAMERISNEKQGVLLLLSGKETAETLFEKMQQFNNSDNGLESIKKNPNQGLRTVGIGSQILHQLGVGKMRLMSQAKHYYALSGFNLEVVEYIQTEDSK